MTSKIDGPEIPSNSRSADFSRTEASSGDDCEAIPERSDEDLFRLFAGHNAGRFIKAYRAYSASRFVLSLNFAAALFALPWFFFRKMYVLGAVLFLAPVALAVVFPTLSGMSLSGLTVVVAMYADHAYVVFASARIKAMKSLQLPSDVMAQRLVSAGGTSRSGAVFGLLIIVSAIALTVVDRAGPRLPGCGHDGVRKLTDGLLADLLPASPEGSVKWRATDFKSTGYLDDGDRNLCSFSAVRGDETRAMVLLITWEDPSKKRYRVRVGSTLKTVLE